MSKHEQGKSKARARQKQGKSKARAKQEQGKSEARARQEQGKSKRYGMICHQLVVITYGTHW